MSPPPRYSTRIATALDAEHLWEVLYYASHSDEEPGVRLAELKTRPELARYVAGWGRSTDLGVIAIDVSSSRAIGAAWLRLLSGADRGYGWVDDETPELAIATLPGHRGAGAGTLLLRELLARALERHARVSLSVRLDNPARRLYERFGFELVVGSEKPNRVGGLSGIMKLERAPWISVLGARRSAES